MFLTEITELRLVQYMMQDSLHRISSIMRHQLKDDEEQSKALHDVFLKLDEATDLMKIVTHIEWMRNRDRPRLHED